MYVVSFKVKTPFLAKLNERVRQEGVSRSCLIRTVLEDYLQSERTIIPEN